MQPKIIRIGRGETDAQGKPNDIIIKDSSISRAHLEVFIDPEGQVFITDLNSTNGTYVNGVSIKGYAALKKGDELKLGNNQIINWQDWVQENKAQTNFTNETNYSAVSVDQQYLSLPKNKKSTSIIILASLLFAVLISTLLIVFKDSIFDTSSAYTELILNKGSFEEKTFSELIEIVENKPKVFEINSGDILVTQDSVKVLVTVQNDLLTAITKVENSAPAKEETTIDKNPVKKTDQQKSGKKSDNDPVQTVNTNNNNTNNNTVNSNNNNNNSTVTSTTPSVKTNADGVKMIQIAKGGEKLNTLIARIKNTPAIGCSNPGDREGISILNQNNTKISSDIKKKMIEDESYVVPSGTWIMFKCN